MNESAQLLLTLDGSPVQITMSGNHSGEIEIKINGNEFYTGTGTQEFVHTVNYTTLTENITMDILLNDSVLVLGTLDYTYNYEIIESEPYWNSNITRFNATGGETLELDLDSYFVDDDNLTYLATGASNITIEVDNSLLRITPDLYFVGERTITAIATDEYYVIQQDLRISVLEGVNVTEEINITEELNQTEVNITTNITTNVTTNVTTNITTNVTTTISAMTFAINEKIKIDNKILGKKISDELDYEVYFTNITKTNETLTIEFYHDYNVPLPVFIDGNINYSLSSVTANANETITLIVGLFDEIIPRFELHVGITSEVFEFGKKIPKVKLKNKELKIKTKKDKKKDLETEWYEIIDRDDEFLDVFIKKANSTVYITKVNGTDITGLFDWIQGSVLTTEFFAADPIEMESATITLSRDLEKDVTKIFECADFDLVSQTCPSSWTLTNIPFVKTSKNITFTVDHFSGYGGGQIEVINVQSYPMVGREWTVMFNTTGVANLTISASDGTTWSNSNEANDLKFLEVKCGNTTQSYQWINNQVFIENYNCSSLSYETSKALTEGEHTLKFQFGDDIAYAYNTAYLGSVWNFILSTWNPNIEGGMYLDDEYVDVKIQKTGTVIAGGTSRGYNLDGTKGAFISAHDKHTGTQFWNTTFDYSGSHDTVYGLALDTDDRVIVAGSTAYGGGQGFIVRFQADGTYHWNKTTRLGTAASSGNYFGVATDSSNNIIAVGRALNANSDAYIIKYSPASDMLWNTTFENGSGTLLLNDVAIDSNDDIVVAGEYHTGANNDWYIAKFNSAGVHQWNRTHRSSAGDFHEYAKDIAVDSNDNVIVTGYDSDTSNWNIQTIKYDSNGVKLWNQSYDTGGSDQAFAVTVDSHNNIIVGGYNLSKDTAEAIILRYDENGKLLNDIYHLNYINSFRVYGLAADDLGDVTAVGYAIDPSKELEGYIAKFRFSNPPTATTPGLTSTFGTNFTTENLTMAPKNSEDPSGNLTTNVTNWYKNGKSTTVLNMPFDIDTPYNVLDYSQYEHNGSLGSSYASRPNWTADGISGGAFTFDGVGDYIDIPASTDFDVVNLTIGAWVYSTNYAQNMFIFEKGIVNTQYAFFFESTNMNFRTYNQTGATWDNFYVTQAALGLTNSKQHYLVATYDGSNKKIYVDGVLQATQTFTGVLKTGLGTAERIGAYGGGAPFYFFDGIIDEVRVYDQALTADQIKLNNNSGAPKYDQVAFTETSLGDVWHAEVKPTSRQGNGTSYMSNPLKIGRAPTQDTPILNSTDLSDRHNQNITVWPQSVSDPDSSPVQNITNWYKDSKSLTLLNMPFEGTEGIHYPSTENSMLTMYFENNAKDFSGKDNHGIPIGSPTYTDAGKIDGAYDFDGTDDYINAGNDSTLHIYKNMTISAWISLDVNANDWVRVVGKGNMTHRDYGLWLETDGDLLLQIQGTTNCNFHSNLGPGDDANIAADSGWRHIVGTYNGTTGIMYVDGIEVHSSSCTVGTIHKSGNSTTIGYATFHTFFNGKIDEVVVSNRTLGPTQVRELQKLAMDRVNDTIDYSGYGNDGDVFDATWGATSGRDGSGAYTFDGTNDYIKINSSTLEIINKNFTVSSWVKFTEDYSAKEGGIIEKGGWNSGEYGMVFVGSNAPRFQIQEGNPNAFVDGTSTLNDGNWHFVAGTWDGQNMKMYVDGKLEATESNTGSFTPDAENLYIGSRLGSSNYFKGEIDEVKIFNHTLSAEQIFELNKTPGFRTIVNAETVFGEVWYADVTPKDSYEDGLTTRSNNITILDVIDTCGDNITRSTTLTDDISGTGKCLTFREDDITLDCDGYSIIGDGAAKSIGVNITERANIDVINCVIQGWQNGIYAKNTEGLDIINNTFSNNISGASVAYDILIYNINSTRIINNTANSNNTQSFAYFTSDPNYITYNINITNNIITNIQPTSSVNLLISAGGGTTDPNINNVRIIGNQLIGRAESLDLQFTNNSLVENNTAKYTSTTSSVGLFGVNNLGENNIFRNNTIYTNSSAHTVGIYAGHGLKIIGNQIYNVTIGIATVEGQTALNFEENITIENNVISNLHYGTEQSKGIKIKNIDYMNSNVTIKNNIVNGADFDLYIEDAYNVYIIDSVIQNYSINASGVIFENTSTGKIMYIDRNITANGTDLIGSENSDIKILNQTIFINSLNSPGLNESANISHYGLDFASGPHIYADRDDDDKYEEICVAPICSELIYTAGLFVYNTTHFTSYLSDENSAPNTTQVILNATWDFANASANLTCYANLTDFFNTSLTAYYTWFNNSIEDTRLSGSTAVTAGQLTLVSTLYFANTTQGETWTCSVQAGDGEDREVKWNNASIQISPSCGDTLKANLTYLLTGDVGTTTDCFTLGGRNITLDCQGFAIRGDTNAASGDHAIYCNSAGCIGNFTMKNCNVYNFSNPLYRYFSDSYFYNNTFVNQYTHNYISGGFGNNFTSNNFTNQRLSAASAGSVLQFSSSDRNILKNNYFFNNAGWDIYLTGTSDTNTILNNTIDASNKNKYTVYTSVTGGTVNTATFENNTIINQGTAAGSWAYYFQNANTPYTFIGNNDVDGENMSEYFYYNKNNLLLKDLSKGKTNIFNWGQIGMYLCDNVTIKNSLFENHSKYEIYMREVSSLSILNNTLNEGTTKTIYGVTISNATIENNTITTGGGIQISGIKGVTINNNTIKTTSTNSNALYLQPKTTTDNNLIIKENNLDGINHGIHTHISDSNVRLYNLSIYNNFMTDSYIGMYVQGGVGSPNDRFYNANVYNNTIYDTNDGIHIQNAYTNLTFNNISDCGSTINNEGIIITTRPSNVSNNTVTNCGVGMYLNQVALPSNIYKNNLSNNAIWGIRINQATFPKYLRQNITQDNSINGKPPYYYFRQDGLVLENMSLKIGQGVSTGVVTVVDSKNVKINNNTFASNAASVATGLSPGIGIFNMSNSVIENNTINSTEFAMEIHSAFSATSSANYVFQNNSIRNNLFTNTTDDMLYFLDGMINTTIINNTFENQLVGATYAIHTNINAKNLPEYTNISNNIFNNVRNGFYYITSTNNKPNNIDIGNNIFTNIVTYAIRLDNYMSNNLIHDNTIINVTQSSSYASGIYIYYRYTKNNTIRDNFINNSWRGIVWYDTAANNTAYNNRIYNSRDVGLYVDPYWDSGPYQTQLIYNNTVCYGKDAIEFTAKYGFANTVTHNNTFCISNVYPINETTTEEVQFDVSFNATNIFNETHTNCTLFIDNTNFGYNDSMDDKAITNITMNAAASVGVHNLSINCTDKHDNVHLINKIEFEILKSETICGETISEDTTLESNIYSNTTCLTIDTDSIVLDCAGYTLTGNRTNTNYGVLISGGRTNVTVKNCYITNFTHGIYADSNLINGWYINNTATNIGTYGFFLESAANLGQNNTLFNNTAINCSLNGYEIRTFNTTMIDNNAYNSTSRGILISSDENIILRGEINNSGQAGILFNSAFRNTIAGVRFANNTNYGIDMTAANHNLIENNTFLGLQTYQIHAGSVAHNTTIRNNQIDDTAGSYTTAILASFKTVSNLTIFNNTIQNSGGNAIDIAGGANNTIIENNTLSGNAVDLSYAGYSKNIKLINTRIADYALSFLTEFSIENTSTGKIYFLESVTEAGTDLFGSTVSDIQIDNNYAFVNSTPQPGFDVGANITLYNVPDYVNKGVYADRDDDGYYEERCIAPKCSNLSYSGGTYIFNTTGFTAFSILLDCGIITNDTTLINDVVSSSTCITILNKNITLNCEGYTITGNRTGSTYGVSNNGYDNLTIKNCDITNFSTAIYSIGAGVNNTIFNNTLRNSLNYGVQFTTQTDSRVENNTIYNNIDQGFIMSSCYRIQVINNNVTNSSVGIGADPSYNITFRNNIATDNSVTSFSATDSKNITFINNTVAGTTITGFSIRANTTKIINCTATTATTDLLVDAEYPSYDLQIIDSRIGDYNINNATNLILKNSSSGQIFFLRNLKEDGTDLFGGSSSDIRITNTSVFVSSSTQPGFNVSANITLYPLGYAGTPTIYIDQDDDGKSESICVFPRCENLSYDNNIFIFNVTQFTTYRLNDNLAPTADAPYCAAHQPIGDRVDANLVSYWQFEHESNKTSLAVDSVGDNNGTLTSVTFTDEGRIGSAYLFDGNGDKIVASFNESLNITNTVTLSAWVKFDSFAAGAGRSILGKDDSYCIHTYDDSLFGDIWVAGVRQNPQMSNAKTNRWYHMVTTYDRSAVKLYVDGVQTDSHSTTGNIDNTSREFNFGDDCVYTTDFNGTIDQVMVFNRSLTASEVYELFRDGNISLVSNVTADQDIGAAANVSDYEDDSIKMIYNWYKNGTSITVLNMPFEGGSNTTWTRDYSPYGNNGTVTGAYWNSTGGVDGKGAYQFDGASSNHINSSLNTTAFSKISVTAWVNADTLTAWDSVVSRTDDNSWNEGWGLAMNGTTSMIFWVDHYADSASVVFTDTDSWHFFAGTYDGTTQKIYMNGILQDSEDDTWNNHAKLDTLIGSSAGASGVPSYFFDGTIDEVMIFNRSLSPEQILALYQLETNRIASNETVRNDTWYAEVTPNDGYLDGDTLQCNNVTIVNARPDTLNVIINSTDNILRVGSDLACHAVGYDIDLDTPLTAHYQWYNNSVLIPSLSGTTASITPNILSLVSTLGSGNTSKTETWTCEVKFYDGFINETSPYNSSQSVYEISSVLKFAGGVLKLTEDNVNLKLNYIT